MHIRILAGANGAGLGLNVAEAPKREGLLSRLSPRRCGMVGAALRSVAGLRGAAAQWLPTGCRASISGWARPAT